MPFLVPLAGYFLVLISLGTVAGCAPLRTEQSSADQSPSTGDGVFAESPKSSAQLQLEVMDFSDRYVDGMWAEIDSSFGAEPDPAKRVAALSWKLRYGSSSMEIAAGADPRTNLLDMAIFISAGEWALDRYWIPEVFGEKGSGLRRHYREMNRQVWNLVDETLTEEQTKLLRSLIDQWIATNPAQHEMAAIRFRNLEGVHPADFRRDKSARGLLASVRRWLGAVNTSLLYGERVLFYVERTPRILNQQTDLTLAQIAHDFPITTFQPDLNAVTDYLEALPGRLQAGFNENPYLFQDVLPGVTGTIASTQELVTSSTQLVTSATELSTNVNITLDRLNALAGPAGETHAALDIQASLNQAVTALASLDSSVAGLNQLLATDEAGSSKLTVLVEHLDGRADHLLARVFERALWLMAFFFIGSTALLVLARWLFPRATAPPFQPDSNQSG